MALPSFSKSTRDGQVWMKVSKAFGFLLLALPVAAQKIPDAHCEIEDYPVKAVVAWQFPETLSKVEVVILRDPAGEQEARFDLLHGASLISLRYQGKEILFGQSAGASVSMFATRHGGEAELKNMAPYWSAYSPDQGGSSMGIAATTEGVACEGQKSMRAFATMIDRGVDNSFLQEPLLGLSQGVISKNFPPGYSTPYVIETDATWKENPGGSPKYYLRLDQDVVRTRPGKSGPLEWYLTAASPWDFGHWVSYPDRCTEKAPCSSPSTNALAAGRYEDDARSVGLAVVVPTSPWQSKRAYIRENAEYVVLLYNAVWAFPRHTFAAVLERSLEGVSSFRFSWYVCAGSWDQAVHFAQGQPQPGTKVLPEAPEPPPTTAAKQALRISCETTEFKPQPNQVDQAILLMDPAREQRVLFDTTQGGAIVSLKYKGIEHIWGYNGGGLLQMAFHNRMTAGPWEGDYNPTQAGDGSAMSPVTGIACDGTNAVTIMTAMLDFNHNNGFYNKPLIAVWGGRVNEMVPLSYFSPYVLETRARWVPNPAGQPKYYLALNETLVHVADETIGPFAFDFADYMPWRFAVRAVSPDNCPCPSSSTAYMAGGWYQDGNRNVGLAVAMPSGNFPGSKVDGGFNSDYMWRNRSFHLSSSDSVDGISSKQFVWYVMPGPWRNALFFVQKLK
jgi:hypothetical protein